MGFVVRYSSSLGSVLVAAHLSKMGADFRVEWDGDFMASHRGANVGGIEVNNGYHVIEYPRSEKLVSLLEWASNTKAELFPKYSWLFVQGLLIDSRAPSSSWPELKLPSGYLWQADTSDRSPYIEFLSKMSTRFSQNWEDSKHLFDPWFLPSNWIGKDEDEGALFRSAYRTGKVPAQVAVFGNGLMEQLRKSILVNFQSQRLIPTIPERNNSQTGQYPDQKPLGEGDRVMRLTVFTTATLVTDFTSIYDEVLVADSRAPELNRVWFSDHEGRVVLVGEAFHSGRENPTVEESQQTHEVINEIAHRFFSNSGSKTIFAGSQITRTINVSKLRQLELWKKSFDVEKSGDEVMITVKSMGTANMNKVSFQAAEAVERARQLLFD